MARSFSSLRFYSLIFQPICNLLRKKRGEGLIYAGIVVIEPCKGFRTEKVGQNCRCIYVTACQCLEREPVAELCLSGLAAEENVFMPDAVAAFAIKARLVGSNHSRKERLRVCLPSDALRAFMNTEIITDAMASTMTEIAAGLP